MSLLSRQVDRLAASILAKSPAAVASGKQPFSEHAELGIEAAYACAAEVMAGDMTSEGAGEGIDAFPEKRAPQWTGR
jgi:enoyl-CoA hydratase/carnithine racemase